MIHYPSTKAKTLKKSFQKPKILRMSGCHIQKSGYAIEDHWVNQTVMYNFFIFWSYPSMVIWGSTG